MAGGWPRDFVSVLSLGTIRRSASARDGPYRSSPLRTLPSPAVLFSLDTNREQFCVVPFSVLFYCQF